MELYKHVGSHTHSVVSGPESDGKIIVYNSGTASVRDEEELESCIGNIPGDKRTALFRIDVIEIPISDPSKARIVKSPAVFADEKTGALGGLGKVETMAIIPKKLGVQINATT